MNAADVLGVLGQGVAVTGAVVLVVATLGLLRLGDVYMRASSVATAAGLGVALIVTGVLLVDPGPVPALIAAAAVALQLATSAVAGIAVGRAAVLSDHEFSPETRHEEEKTT